LNPFNFTVVPMTVFGVETSTTGEEISVEEVLITYISAN